MGLWNQILRVIKGEAYAAVARMENPIKTSKVVIEEAKIEVNKAIDALAEIKSIQLQVEKELDSAKKEVGSNQSKAEKLLDKRGSGEIDEATSERLIKQVLQLKLSAQSRVDLLSSQIETYNKQYSNLRNKIISMKNQIEIWESDYQMMSSRYASAKAMLRISKMTSMSSDSLKEVLKSMEQKVSQMESTAQAYSELEVDLSSNSEVDQLLNLEDKNLQEEYNKLING